MRLILALCALCGCSREGLPVAPPGTAFDEAACSFDGHGDPTRAVVAFTVDHDVRLAFADGSTRTVYTFASQLPSPSTSFIGRIDDARADRLIAEGSTYEAPPGLPARDAHELVLLDRTGRVIWHRSADGFGTPYLGADGTLAVWTTSQETVVVAPDGAERIVAGKWSPVAPAPDGSLLVQDPPPGGDGMLGWLRPQSPSVQMLAIQPSGYETWVGDQLAYVGKQNGRDALVLATPDASRVVALPDGDGSGLAIAGAAGDWLEVQRVGASAPTLYRVEVGSGAVDPILEQPPSGLRRFDAGSGALLADDGSLVAAFRDDFVGGLYRSTDAGSSWTALGFSVANVQGLGLVASAGGTFVAQSVRAVYAPSSPWADPPSGVSPELSGPSVQLVRPGDGVRYQLPPLAGWQPVALGSAGRCAAYWAVGSDGHGHGMTGRLEALDVERSRRTTLVDGADASAAQPPRWLEQKP